MNRQWRMWRRIGQVINNTLGKLGSVPNFHGYAWPTMVARIFTFFLALFVMVLPGHSNAADPRDKNPPEVKALIGMKISSNNPAIPHGDIPGFHEVGGTVMEELADRSALVLEEGFANTTPAFLIGKTTEGATSIEVLDAQAMPPKLYEYRLNLKKKSRPPVDWLSGRYMLAQWCSYNDATSDQIIIGLVKPEVGKEDCGHDSRLVGRAWKIDRKTGQIEAVSTRGLRCYYLTAGSCD